MKRLNKTLVIGIILALAIISTTYHSRAQEDKKIFVGLLFDQFASDRWQIDAKYLSQQLKSLGAETSVKVAHSDASKQIAQAKELIDAGVDMLIVISVDGTKSKEIVAMAKAKGVYVVAYDRPILDSGVDLFFSFDSREVGKLQAKSAVAAVPKGNYFLLNGPVTDNNAIQVKKGQMDILAPYIQSGKIKIVGDISLVGWHEMTAMMALLESDVDKSDIDCIISGADMISSGVIEYLEDEAEMRRVFITGQDANYNSCENIKLGYQNMTILKPIKTLAFNSANYAFELLKNKSKVGLKKIKIDDFEFDGMLFDIILIDQSNVGTNAELRDQLDALKIVAK